MTAARNGARSSARRTTTTDKPKITGLNLDTLQRDDAPEEPYRTVLNGRPYVFRDPLEEDWQDSMKIDANNVVSILKSLLSDDDWDEFAKVRMENWKLIALARDITAYYKADLQSEGNDNASPTS